MTSTTPAGATPLQRLAPQHALIAELQRSVRQGPAELADRPRAHSPRPRSTGATPVELPFVPLTAAPSQPGDSLDDVLDRRESVRFYREEPVAAQTVAQVVRAGRHADATAWPAEAEAGLGIDLIVAARRMAGAAPAIYRLEEGGFAPLAPLDDADDLVLQIEYAWSPVILMAVAPLADALDRWGDHGERLVNIRSGAAIAAALHEAAALGLVGSPFAGFLTSGLRRLLDVDGYANAQLFAASFGHPVDGGEAFTGRPR